MFSDIREYTDLTLTDVQNWMKSVSQLATVGTMDHDMFAKLSVENGVVTE